LFFEQIVYIFYLALNSMNIVEHDTSACLKNQEEHVLAELGSGRPWGWNTLMCVCVCAHSVCVCVCVCGCKTVTVNHNNVHGSKLNVVFQ